MKLPQISLLLLAFALFSCAEEETVEPTCQTCRAVVTDVETGEEIVSNSKDAEYCDSDLESVKAEEPREFDGATSEWVCK